MDVLQHRNNLENVPSKISSQPILLLVDSLQNVATCLLFRACLTVCARPNRSLVWNGYILFYRTYGVFF
jgi:hypothetical protein